MGAIYHWKCNKCWHSFKAFLGYGRRDKFPEEVTEAAREGEYEGRPLLAAYRPGMKPNDSNDYICMRDYNHRCRCGHRMWPIYEEECFSGLPCPYCSGTLKPEEAGYWD